MGIGAEGDATSRGNDRWRAKRLFAGVAVAAAFALTTVTCGNDEESRHLEGPPKGVPVLPDLVPEPPIDLQTKHEVSGAWSMRFSSTLVNVGEADFILHGDRVGDHWVVEQQVAFSESGSELRPTDADIVWGGDGHDHWHVKRVATYRIEAVDDAGTPMSGGGGRSDTKVGFCFFDSHKKLDGGPKKAQYKREGCGKETDTQFLMGLSPSWGDVYDITLPGQSVDITDLPDGRYRIWAEADPQGWFTEVTRDNNVTWADVKLSTRPADGLRVAVIVGTGPTPAPISH
ncbi:MAG TPA: lysyl oxidase family protein [Ilumatobacteraceae bacterium]|nr:lysyl oxidase family protein [Ilumatobacteraceae bacterium]